MDVILARLDSVPTVENLAFLASKQDIKEMDDRITAQSTEITQLRNEMRSMQGNFNNLQTTVDSQLAANISMASGSVGRDLTRDPGRTTYKMADGEPNTTQSGLSRRRNLVFEGLKGENDMDIRANVINIGSAIGIKVFNCEIEQVLRMPRRDNQNKKPGPVLITLSRTLLRDSFLRKKSELMKCTGMEEIFVNADESIEVRRAKSFLRKASFNAKCLGETVEFRHNDHHKWNCLHHG